MQPFRRRVNAPPCVTVSAPEVETASLRALKHVLKAHRSRHRSRMLACRTKEGSTRRSIQAMSARTELLETLRPMCRNTLRPYQYTCTQHRQRMRIQEQGNCSVQHQPFSNGQQACNSEVTSQRMLSHAHPLTYCRPRSSSRSAALGDLRHRDHDNLFQPLHFYRHHHPHNTVRPPTLQSPMDTF